MLKGHEGNEEGLQIFQSKHYFIEKCQFAKANCSSVGSFYNRFWSPIGYVYICQPQMPHDFITINTRITLRLLLSSSLKREGKSIYELQILQDKKATSSPSPSPEPLSILLQFKAKENVISPHSHPSGPTIQSKSGSSCSDQLCRLAAPGRCICCCTGRLLQGQLDLHTGRAHSLEGQQIGEIDPPSSCTFCR